MTQVLATADFDIEWRKYVSGTVIDFADADVITLLGSRKVIDARATAVTAAVAAGAAQVVHVAGKPRNTRQVAYTEDASTGVPSLVPGSAGALMTAAGSAGYLVVDSGDSTGEMGYDYSAAFAGAAGDTSLSNYGWQFQLQFHLCVPLNWRSTAVKLMATDHLVNIQLPQILAMSPRPRVVFTRVGINEATVPLTASQSIANLKYFGDQLKAAGIRWAPATVSPVEVMGSSKTRYSAINKYLRDRSASDWDWCRVHDINSLMADGANADGGAWSAANGFKGTYDGTHQNPTTAMCQGEYMEALYGDWFPLLNFIAYANGDTGNLLTNSGFGVGLTGGTAGAFAPGGGGTIPDNWITTRSATNITVPHKVYPVFSLKQTLRVGDKPRRGQRCKVPGIDDVHYIVVTASDTAVATLPSSKVLFDDTVQPDAGGPVFLVLPANDLKPWRRDPFKGHPYWSLFIEVSDTTPNPGPYANTQVGLAQSITSGFAVGDRLRQSMFMEMLGGPWQGFTLRLEGKAAGGAKTHDSHAPSFNIANENQIRPDLRGMCAGRDVFTVRPGDATFLFRYALFNLPGSVKTRCLVHHPAAENLGPA